MDGPEYERKWPVIIAMQGEPYSGKSMVANKVLGGFVNYPIITLDDILDGLSPTCPANVEIVMSQAFDIITCMVKTYTSMGRSVIIDSPLSRRSHLDKLVSLLTSVNVGTTPHLSLIIIECKPSNQYWRKMMFMNRDRTTSDKWYKPQDWPPHPKFTGRDYTNDDIHPMVSKLVLDCRKSYDRLKLLGALHCLTADLHGKVTELLYYLQEFDESNNPHKIDRPPLSQIEKEWICQNAGHAFKEEKGTDNDKACRICKGQVIASSSDDGVYTCINCSLVIHKSCAEAGATKSYSIGAPIHTGRRCNISSPQPCTICRKRRLKFRYDCAACLSELNMQCGILPTIVHHQMHSHHFQLSITANIMQVDGLCEACYGPIRNISYLNRDSVSRVAYHPTCLLSPLFLLDHKHCGYTHDLELVFERDEEFDDYLCHLCFDYTLPYAWYYRCKECCLDLHIWCAYKEFK